MNGTTIIPRRLEPEGCITAGSQVKAEAKGLGDAGVTLHGDVTTQVATIGSWTSRIQEFLNAGNKMWDVDRGADRAIAALNNGLNSKEASFSHGDILPLTADEQEHLALVVEVRSEVLPTGRAS